MSEVNIAHKPIITTIPIPHTRTPAFTTVVLFTHIANKRVQSGSTGPKDQKSSEYKQFGRFSPKDLLYSGSNQRLS